MENVLPTIRLVIQYSTMTLTTITTMYVTALSVRRHQDRLCARDEIHRRPLARVSESDSPERVTIKGAADRRTNSLSDAVAAYCATHDPPTALTVGGIRNSQVEARLYFLLYACSAFATSSSLRKSAAESVVFAQYGR